MKNEKKVNCTFYLNFQSTCQNDLKKYNFQDIVKTTSLLNTIIVNKSTA